MPGLSKVIVLDPDVRAGRQVQLGFEREGVPTAAIPADRADPAALDLLGDLLPGDLPGDDVGLVVVGGVNGQGLALVRRSRALLADRQIDVPILFAGRGIERRDAEAAGADEVVQQPAYLRDVVTIGRLLRGQPTSRRGRLVGNLAEITGVFTLVRALATMGRSATLTLSRGLRRGEIRFFHGEVTSAQIGMIHGQAALHQLLLWTDARFDFHHEDIVRRQQIPLTHQELFADAERFLESVRGSSGGLSPSMVLDQDALRVRQLGQQIPTEVFGVLRMFDGHRVLADVLEDSAYRVFETLRVAQRAVEAGLLRVVESKAPRAAWRTILSIEEWLVGLEPPERAAESGPMLTQASDPAAREPDLTTTRNQRGQRDQREKTARKPRRKKKRKVHAPPAPPAPPIASAPPRPIDWGALVPRIIGAEVGPLAGVVPAAHVSGEIVSATSGVALERNLPAAQPTIVFDEAGEAAHDAGVKVGREMADPLAYADQARFAAVPAAEAAETAEAAPAPVADEPSDGVIRHHITTAETAPVKRRRAPTVPPDDDRPEDTAGEITAPRPRATREPRVSEPSILVPDLAVIHAEVSAVASGQVTAPVMASAASPARAAVVASTHADAVAFSDDEEAFFRAGHEKEATRVLTAPSTESFDDLDEGYRPVGFWDRLRGRGFRRPDTPLSSDLLDARDPPEQREQREQREPPEPSGPRELRDSPGPEPGKPEPGKPEPGKPEPGKPEPGKPEPGKPEPGKK